MSSIIQLCGTYTYWTIGEIQFLMENLGSKWGYDIYTRNYLKVRFCV